MEDARAYCTAFFVWYNTIHRHSGVGLHTPCDMHHGLADARRAQRAVVLMAAYQAAPHRFVNQLPVPAAVGSAATDPSASMLSGQSD